MKFLLLIIQTHWRTCTIMLLVAVTALSLWPEQSLPTVPGGDKFHHLVAYAALVFPVALRRPRLWQLIILSFIPYSGLVELIQPLVHRYGEWLDLAANATGLVCGVLFAELVRRWGGDVRNGAR